MAIDKLGSVASAVSAPATQGPQEKFGKALGEAHRSVAGGQHTPVLLQPGQRAAAPARGESAGRVLHGASAQRSQPLARVDPAREVAKGIDRVELAQRRLDKILHLAEGGKTFTPAELLALQAQVYQASNEIDLAGKVVDKATGGVKQILQTQV